MALVALALLALAALPARAWEVSVPRVANFSLRSCEGKLGPFPSHFPASVHTDLIGAGVIRVDPYYRYEEKNLSWVPQQCWLYESAPFSLPQDGSGNFALRIERIDSVATVSINGHVLPLVVNGHRDHTFILDSAVVKAEGNVLRLQFVDVLQYAKSQASKYPYVVPETQNYNVWAEPTSRNFVRKAGSDFGWDWGPAFVQMGVADLRIFREGSGKLDDVVVTYALSEDLASARVQINALVTPTGSERWATAFVVFVDGKQAASRNDILVQCASAPCKVPVASFTLDDVKLWWPRGYGEQHLYAVELRLLGGKGSYQTVSKRTGFRSVQLVQTPLTASEAKVGSGPSPTTFYFRVNGLPIFMAGANFIPIDSFSPRVLPSDREYIFQAAVETNMNMLRVWGGGIYQPSDFYDLADKYGVMIWQEVMLACALYPRDAAFLAEVEAEVKQQVARLSTHPSIVVFGGNNENEVALSWFPESSSNRDLFVADYSQLYANTVYPAVAWALEGSPTAWVDSSPSNGLLSTDPYVKLWGHASTAAAGDMHFYDYSCDCESAASFPDAKFVSEFGFQSTPSFLAYEPVISPQDYAPDSPLLQFRQRHEGGDAQMQAQIERHFLLPATCSAQRDLDMYLYLSQLQQSNCYSTAVQHWRQIKGVDDATNPSRNSMGVLYWQLNDIWQGPSWSSMESSGRWKPLQYAMRRSFAPLLLSLDYRRADGDADSAQAQVYLVNERLLDVEVKLLLELIPWAGGTATLVKSATVIAAAQRSSLVDSYTVTADFLRSMGCDFSSCYLRVSATPLALGGPAQAPHAAVEFQRRALLTAAPADLLAIQALVPFKDTVLPVANYSIFISNVQPVGRGVAFSLRSVVTAPFLFLELANLPSAAGDFARAGVFSAYGGWFSANNFVAEAGHTYAITYQPAAGSDELSVEEFARRLQARSLQHAYACGLPLRPSFI